ncbi:MAG: FMN-binding protein, partial [Actinobacteria bacterium]|nr:FMN-binding protein [Actinomycetota bacterium]
WLQDEVLQVQSAQINGISGATYTSGGFKASLASALQKAGL